MSGPTTRSPNLLPRVVAVESSNAAKADSLVPTAVKTSAYVMAANDYVPVDTTSGAVTVTLPSAPADGVRVGIKHVIQGSTNAVLIACGGSDVFNKTGGSTSLTLSLLNQAMLLQYKASTGIWYVQADDITLAALDARFASAAGLTAIKASRVLGITIDGGGSVIPTGVKGYLTVPFTGIITGWTLLADAAGSVVVDIWKDTYANYPPTVADTITAAAKPTLSAAQKATSSTLTGWTTAVTTGDVLAFNIDSAATLTRLSLSLAITTS